MCLINVDLPDNHPNILSTKLIFKAQYEALRFPRLYGYLTVSILSGHIKSEDNQKLQDLSVVFVHTMS